MKACRLPIRAMLCSLALALLAASPALAASVTLAWTAPGDDSLSGRATQYELRYSKQPISAGNFPSATRVTGLPPPGLAGSTQSFIVTGLSENVLYYFAMRTADECGNWSGLSNVQSSRAVVVAVEGGPVAPAFSVAAPNPADATTHFAYSLPAAGLLRVEIFDIQGRRVAGLADGPRPAGEGHLDWDLHAADGRRVAQGVYLVRVSLAGRTLFRRVTVVD